MKALLLLSILAVTLTGCRGYAVKLGVTIKPPGVSVAIVPTETEEEAKAKQIGQMILAADAGHESAEAPLPVK